MDPSIFDICQRVGSTNEALSLVVTAMDSPPCDIQGCHLCTIVGPLQKKEMKTMAMSVRSESSHTHQDERPPACKRRTVECLIGKAT